mgnify:CR=1 FL=1
MGSIHEQWREAPIRNAVPCSVDRAGCQFDILVNNSSRFESFKIPAELEIPFIHLKAAPHRFRPYGAIKNAASSPTAAPAESAQAQQQHGRRSSGSRWRQRMRWVAPQRSTYPTPTPLRSIPAEHSEVPSALRGRTPLNGGGGSGRLQVVWYSIKHATRL